MTEIIVDRLNRIWHVLLGFTLSFIVAAVLLSPIHPLSSVILGLCYVLSSVVLVVMSAKWTNIVDELATSSDKDNSQD